MKKFLAITALFLLLLAGCIQTQPGTQTGGPGGAGGLENASAANSTVEIKIENMAFEKSLLIVDPGTTVVWTNMDAVQHTVTSEGNFDSGAINTSETFSHTFNTSGMYNYICTSHPSMRARVIVR